MSTARRAQKVPPPPPPVDKDLAWRVVLERVRAQEDWRGLAAVQQQGHLAALLSVWPLACGAWEVPPAAPPDHLDAAWDCAWSPSLIRAAAERAAQMLGWEWERGQETVLAAVALRLVYPDGEVHQQAASAVRAAAELLEVDARVKLRALTLEDAWAQEAEGRRAEGKKTTRRGMN